MSKYREAAEFVGEGTGDGIGEPEDIDAEEDIDDLDDEDFDEDFDDVTDLDDDEDDGIEDLEALGMDFSDVDLVDVGDGDGDGDGDGLGSVDDADEGDLD